MSIVIGLVVLLVNIVGDPRAAAQSPPLAFSVELHGSAFNNQQDRSLLSVSFGGGLRIAYRPRGRIWGAHVFFEQNAWLATELSNEVVPGVRNVGAGLELLWADGIVRSSLTVGVSVLAYDTELDDKGANGLFFDLRPASLRWRITDAWTFEFTPLHFVLVAPVLRSPRLVSAQYRTTITLEFSLE